MIVCIKCSNEYECYGQRRKICRPCKQEYDRDYYSKKSKEYKEKKFLRKKDRAIVAKQFIWDHLKNNPCVTCGEADPVVLEFDHIIQSEKEYTISDMQTYSIKMIKKEIEKCRILCANCHRRRTSVQMDWYKNISP